MHPITRLAVQGLAATLFTVTVLVDAQDVGEVVVLRPDLAPLIDAVVDAPSRYAVELPHAVDSRRDGEWRTGAGRATWTYAVRVPAAASLSFHAPQVRLPSGAVLSIAGGATRFAHDARDLDAGSLWSRVVPADTLEIRLDVPVEQAADAWLVIDALQVGYRALAPGRANHPHFDARRRQRAQAAGGESPRVAAAETCVVDAACRTDVADASASTLAVVVRNVAQCTGTLLNDVPGSGTPYVLTARHCQAGGESGDPSSARDVVVYWNAVGTCGAPLRSIYDAPLVQRGATTLVEQLDAWLIRLDAPPVHDGARFAGWDATGATFVGGSAVHHAVGRTQQYVRLFGQAVLATHATGRYSGPVWRTSHDLGNTGFGASGAGLRDPAGRVTGVLSRGAFAGTGTGYGLCPDSSPMPPTTTDWTNEWVALGALWSSAADASSTTNPRTLRSVLDPDGTGRLVVDSLPPRPVIELWPASATTLIGTPVTLEWDARHADACTASGGGPSGGWSGPVPLRGSRTVVETAPGAYAFRITCTRAGRSAVAESAVTWQLPAPTSGLVAAPNPLYSGETVTLAWQSNVGACTAGGGFDGDGWAGARAASGSLGVRSDVPRTTTYELACGTGANAVTSTAFVAWRDTSASLRVLAGAELSPVRVGQAVELMVGGSGRTCTPSGGTPGDGWSSATNATGVVTVRPSAPGSVDYVYTCRGGNRTSEARVALSVTDAPPSARLAAPFARRTAYPAGSGFVGEIDPNLVYTANVRPCRIDYSGPADGTLAPLGGFGGSVRDLRDQPGRYTYTLTCGSGAEVASSTATIDWEFAPAEVFLRAGGSTPYLVGESLGLSWRANVAPCTAGGGAPGDGWAGPRFASGSWSVRPAQPGTYTWTLACGPDGNRRSAEVSATIEAAPPPLVELTTFQPRAAPGESVTVTWRTTYATACTASGGLGGDGWSGTRMPGGGSATVTALVPGLVTYALECSNPAGTTRRERTVEYVGAPVPRVTLTAPPTAIAGRPFTIAWTSTGTERCAASGGVPTDGWAGSRASSGSAEVTVAVPGTVQYQMACGRSPLAFATVRVEPPPPPSLEFSASTAVLTVGATARLTWTARQASACVAEGGAPDAGSAWPGPKPTSGEALVRPTQAGDFVYGLSCSAPGAAAQARVALRVDPAPAPAPRAPAATLTAAAGALTEGQSTTLTWSSTDAVACTASGGAAGDGWAGSLPTAGSRTLTPPAGTHEYVLNCNGDGGSVQARATLTVAARAAAPPVQGGGGNGGGAGGGGGGGAFDGHTLAILALLGALALAARRVRRVTPSRTTPRRAGGTGARRSRSAWSRARARNPATRRCAARRHRSRRPRPALPR